MIRVESLDQEGRGVAHCDGKAVFIDGALPGETVTYSSYRKQERVEFAQLGQVLRPAAERCTPRCRFFGVCGGCSLQHLDVRAQVATKQRVLEDDLWHIGKVRPETILPAIYGIPWGYRYRARFSARYVPKKGGALIGFREKRGTFVTDMTSCEVVPPRISALLVPLRELISALSAPNRVPQVELAIGDGVDALVLRILQPLTGADESLLRVFADRHRVQFFLQPRGPESVVPFYPEGNALLHYTLAEFGLTIEFAPTDFTQVNHAVNMVLVRRAISLLAPQPGESVADMFCGVGNFTLAIARRGAAAVGVEGSRVLVARAQANAALNGLGERANFRQENLFEFNADKLARLGRFDKMLIDPPRDGAVELVKALPADAPPRRLVYVSCNPATLARDAGVLVHVQGYTLTAAGIVNMFPHTSHVESIACFDHQ